MRREIGSDFWSIPQKDAKSSLFENVTWFVSGRAALRAILQQIPQDTGRASLKVALPSYLCESMIKPLEIEGIPYAFYDVCLNNGLIQCDCSTTYDCNVILVLDYFGYESTLIKNQDKNQIVIRDLTHSVFGKDYNDADYYFGSLRKWAGFAGGGFAYKKEGKVFSPTFGQDEYFALRHYAMDLKRQYIFEETDSKEYLTLFHEAEKMLNECEVSICGLNDIEAAEALDVDSIKNARRENAKYLIEGLNDYCLFKSLKADVCPLCVPILCENRDELRRYLVSKRIYCPVHWPKPEQVSYNASKTLYEKELSLVCDQRYTINDMKTIVNEVGLFLEKEKNA